MSKINVHIFLLCYNESILIERTIEHYRKYLPNATITFLDNESTDNSVEIALKHGCNIHSWNSENRIDDMKYLDLKNNIWKSATEGWIIVGDMDEWLCISEVQLQEEEQKGTTILKTIGFNMIGKSKWPDLSDIDMHKLTDGVHWSPESKSLCFKVPEIQEMNYDSGAHTCHPVGKIQYSEREYVNKHMELLGLPFMINKVIARYQRCEYYRRLANGTGPVHYTNNIHTIQQRYYEQLKAAVPILTFL